VRVLSELLTSPSGYSAADSLLEPSLDFLAFFVEIVKMGKAGRIACIFTPYMLTIASLICIILVGLGCTSKGTLDDLYFAKVGVLDRITVLRK
jgi:hypothetical protein